MKHLILLIVLLVGLPTRILALSDDAEMLRLRQLRLFDTDSAEVFMDVSERLKAILEKEGEEEKYYNAGYYQVVYVLDNMSSSQAVDMINELRDYADDHNSKYGFYVVTALNIHLAMDMGMVDRAEELMLEALDYQKRNLPKLKPMTKVYSILTKIYEKKHQGEKAIQVLDSALEMSVWNQEDRIVLMSLKCNAVSAIEPVDTARFMAYYAQLRDMIRRNGYSGNATLNTECYHAQFMRNYSQLLTLSQKIADKGTRLKFKIIAYDGLDRNQEAIDSFRVYKRWTDKQYNAETRKMTEMSALELEAARAENEAETLRLTNQRMMLIATVCGLVVFVAFLAIYLYRRQLKMRQLKQAYDKLEEAYGQLEIVTTQKERIESELRIARNIQLSMVPHEFPSFPEIDLYASMTPAKEVGGDLYDFFVRDNQLYFCIGDVSGKGVPAALFMMMTKSLFRAYSSDESMPDRIVTQMNNILSENNKNHMFVTLFVGVLDMATGLLRYCNAGHEPPIVINKEATFLPIHHVFPVGSFPNTSYLTQEVVIEPQTTILLYTDGLNEAMTADKKMFGKEGILDEANAAIQAGQLSPKVLIDRLAQAVQHFVGDTEQSDDLTMLAINYPGNTAIAQS